MNELFAQQICSAVRVWSTTVECAARPTTATTNQQRPLINARRSLRQQCPRKRHALIFLMAQHTSDGKWSSILTVTFLWAAPACVCVLAARACVRLRPRACVRVAVRPRAFVSEVQDAKVGTPVPVYIRICTNIIGMRLACLGKMNLRLVVCVVVLSMVLSAALRISITGRDTEGSSVIRKEGGGMLRSHAVLAVLISND